MKATNICWDIDEDIVDGSLPDTVELPKEIKEEDIADYLSDKYEFCVFSFTVEHNKEDKDMMTLSEDLMTGLQYHKYIEEECRRQWHECQEETYGTWDSQSDDEKADYYNSLYEQYSDLLGKACCDCRYAGEENGKFFCNFGDSDNYGKEITGRNYCDEFEE